MRFREDLSFVFEEIDDLDYILFDKDGTLVRQDVPFVGVREALEELVGRDKQVVVITNSSATMPINIKKLEEKSGLMQNIHYHHLISAGDIMKDYFAKPEFNDKRFLVLGELLDANIFQKGNVVDIAPDAIAFNKLYANQKYDAIMIGPPYFYGQKQQNLSRFNDAIYNIATSGIPIFAAHWDRGDFDGKNWNVLQGNVLDKIVDIAKKINVRPNISTFGKPETDAFKSFLQKVYPDFNPEKAIIIGDNPCTDVAFGKKLGMMTCLVMTAPRMVKPYPSYVIPAILFEKTPVR